MNNNHASYLDAIFKRKAQDKAIRQMKALIKDIEFDGFVVTGVSGITMGSIMARICKKNLMIIRKEEDNDNHSFYNIENYIPGKRYIFLDDLVASGNTFKRVKREICNLHKLWKKTGYISDQKKSKIIGRLLYADNATYDKGVN